MLILSRRVLQKLYGNIIRCEISDTFTDSCGTAWTFVLSDERTSDCFEFSNRILSKNQGFRIYFIYCIEGLWLVHRRIMRLVFLIKCNADQSFHHKLELNIASRLYSIVAQSAGYLKWKRNLNVFGSLLIGLFQDIERYLILFNAHIY